MSAVNVMHEIEKGPTAIGPRSNDGDRWNLAVITKRDVEVPDDEGREIFRW